MYIWFYCAYLQLNTDNREKVMFWLDLSDIISWKAVKNRMSSVSVSFHLLQKQEFVKYKEIFSNIFKHFYPFMTYLLPVHYKILNKKTSRVTNHLGLSYLKTTFEDYFDL